MTGADSSALAESAVTLPGRQSKRRCRYSIACCPLVPDSTLYRSVPLGRGGKHPFRPYVPALLIGDEGWHQDPHNSGAHRPSVV